MSPAGSKRSGKTRAHKCTGRQRCKSEMIHTQPDPASISGITPSQQLQLCYSNCVGGFFSLQTGLALAWRYKLPENRYWAAPDLKVSAGRVASSWTKKNREWPRVGLAAFWPTTHLKMHLRMPLKQRSVAWRIKSLQNARRDWKTSMNMSYIDHALIIHWSYIDHILTIHWSYIDHTFHSVRFRSIPFFGRSSPGSPACA